MILQNLLHRHALRQVARLVDVGALQYCHMVGEQLQRQRVDQRAGNPLDEPEHSEATILDGPDRRGYEPVEPPGMRVPGGGPTPRGPSQRRIGPPSLV